MFSFFSRIFLHQPNVTKAEKNSILTLIYAEIQAAERANMSKKS